MTELEEPVLTAVMHRSALASSLPAEQRDPKRADDAAERFKTPLGVLNGALAEQECLADAEARERRRQRAAERRAETDREFVA